MNHVRNGFGAVRPYLQGPLQLPDFVQQVFGAQVIERHDSGPTLLKIGDGAVWIEAGERRLTSNRGAARCTSTLPMSTRLALAPWRSAPA
jgi:hypothetical protein